MLLASRNPIVRKGTAYTLQLACRLPIRITAKRQDYADQPPIIVNSIPKSGTHLLLQLARAVPGTRYYGGFVAHAWSVTMRERTRQEIAFRLSHIVPGEVVGAHLYHDPEVARFLVERSAIQLFIYRDPRDLVLSEANYITNMNRWHRLHSVMKSLPDEESRVRALIEGIPGLYGDVGTRLRRFIGWLNEPDVIAVRYEDLQSSLHSVALRDLCRCIAQRAPVYGAADMLSEKMELAIAPERSHTFHQGGSEKWRTQLSYDNLMSIERLAAREIVDLGYALSK